MCNNSIDEAQRLLDKSWDSADAEDYCSAINFIEQAILLDPNNSIFHTTKARYLFDSDKLDDAFVAAMAAIELEPDNFHAWLILGIIERRRENFEKSAYYFGKASDLKEDYNIYTLLASVQYKYDPRLAVISAKKALQLNPDWEEASRLLNIALNKLEKENIEGQ